MSDRKGNREEEEGERGVSGRLLRGEKFHPVEIDLTQEKPGSKRGHKYRERLKKAEKCLRIWSDRRYIYRGREALGRFSKWT